MATLEGKERVASDSDDARGRASTGPRSTVPSGVEGVEVLKPAWTEAAREVLPTPLLSLVATLHRELEQERQRLLNARAERQGAWDAGELPRFLSDAEAGEARGDWRVADLPEDLLVRRVEITGPISDPKMVINMLSRTEDGHRADAAMLDFEDSMKPSWANVIAGLQNLIGAADGTLTHEKRDRSGAVVKRYELDPGDMPLLMVRVRGLHLDESNLFVDGRPACAGVLDLAASAFHTAGVLMERGRTPKYYVPKCEDRLEARWWDRLLSRIEEALEIPPSTLKATFLIETLPAALQMEEILYEIREHAAGLNGGRWDKIFSDIKVLKAHEDRVLADRGSISMNRPWMRDYALQLIRVCHRHGAFGMGGMAAFTPGQTPRRREEQTRKVVEDKELEASFGHDGCWVSHPYFIAPAMAPFERANQLDVIPHLPPEPDLLPRGTDPKTREGLRKNVRVGIAYLKGWHEDVGSIAWDDLMEDLATLEISRAQTWQWLHHAVMLDDGVRVTPRLVSDTFREELATIQEETRHTLADAPEEALADELAAYRDAAEDAEAIFLEEDLRPFLTTSSDQAGAGLDERRARLRQGATR